MGWTFTPKTGNVQFDYRGHAARVHTKGNNVAWVCPKCRGPILFVYAPGNLGLALLSQGAG